jgi:hypothetical protein
MATGSMNTLKADFLQLKWSLLICLSVLCAGSVAIVLSHNFAAHAQLRQQSAQRQLNASRKQLASANEDLENIKAYGADYGELLLRKIIGDEQRLDWIEGLGKVRKQHRVLDFKYTIAPQHPYTPPAPLDSGNFKLNMSDMTLQFDLLHEGQLMEFFDTLRTDLNGRFILDHCTLERNADTDATAQLKAECTGGWLTMKFRNEK